MIASFFWQTQYVEGSFKASRAQKGLHANLRWFDTRWLRTQFACSIHPVCRSHTPMRSGSAKTAEPAGGVASIESRTSSFRGYIWKHHFVICFVLTALPIAASRGEGADPVETLEKAAGDWVKVRAETGRIEAEWSSQKRLLQSMVEALKDRADSAEATRDLQLAKTAKDRGDQGDLDSTINSSTAELQAIETHLKEVDSRLPELRPSLPPRLNGALELPYRSLTASNLTVGERMQLTLAVLSRCIEFNRTITCDSEVLTLADGGNPQLLEVIYWGLSHGYALDRAGGKAWLGSPGPKGWRWEPVPDGAGKVAQLIAVYRGENEPRFVEVPARLSESHTGLSGNGSP